MTVDREHLLSEAARLLTRKPTASMDEIARAAGISRATLHRRFAGRDALVRALEALCLRQLTAALDAAGVDAGTTGEVESSGEGERDGEGEQDGVPGNEDAASGEEDAAGDPERTLRRMIAEVQPVAGFLAFLITENQLFEPGALSCGWRRLDERIGALFQRGQQEGVFRTDLSDAWLTEAFYALVTASAWAVQDGRIAARDRARMPTELLLGGALRRGAGSRADSRTERGR